jgi:hypothetical protein
MGEQIYRCTTDTGKAIFSQFPCGEDATSIEVDPQPTSITTQESSERRKKFMETLNERSKRLERRRLEYRVMNLEAARKALRSKRDRKIEKIEKDINDTYDNQKRALFREKIRDVKDQYHSDYDRLSDKIFDAKLDLSRCCK